MLRVLALTVVVTLVSAPVRAADASSPPEADRKAILGMAGTYDVTFRFRETLPLAEGYELAKPYHEIAVEKVVVVEDTPGRISMQHLLCVGGGHVVKHWRQDWVYEEHTVWRFDGRDKWTKMKLPTDQVAGTWTQKVYQTDDGPRYESPGKWVHVDGVSTWESTITHRPLPRREHTKRSDYQLLLVRNRHTVTATGWTHEQDNTKVVLDDAGRPEKLIAREVGLNSYEKIADEHGSDATKWWAEHGAFWTSVRDAWSGVYAKRDAILLHGKIDGESLAKRLGEIEKAEGLSDAERSRKIHAQIFRYTEPGAPAAASAEASR